MAGNLLKRRTGHPHKAFTSRRDQFSTFGRRRNIALDEYVAIFSQNGCWTGTSGTKLGKCSILPEYFLDFHNFYYCFCFSSMNQNCGFWFIREQGDGLV